ncbi:MAG: rhodanese-like domain-containing protein [Flavitalea sp.]
MKYLLILLSAFILSCNSSAQSIDANQFEKEIKEKKVQLLDVRTPDEYKKGHINQSMLADWMNREEFTSRTQHLDKSTPVYVYCASGGRSASAAKVLRADGFKVVELKGGFQSWRANDKPFNATTVTNEVSRDEYNGMINSKEIVLVDFGAKWCPPCIKMEPVMNDLEKAKDSNVYILKMNADETTQLMKELNVESLPTFIVYKNGKETWRKQGLVTIDEFKSNLK